VQNHPVESAKNIRFSALNNEYSLAPGSSTAILLRLCNQGEIPGWYEISFQGIPSSWGELSVQGLSLNPNEEQELTLNLHLPLPPLAQAGVYHLQVVAVSQTDSSQAAQVEITLRLAAFDGRGRIGVMLESIQYSVPAGGRANVPVLLINPNQELDTFQLSVAGLPLDWLSTQILTARVGPGEAKEVRLVIQPPRVPASRAGRHSFKLKVTSELYPDDTIEVRCVVTVAAYSEYYASIKVDQAENGVAGQLMIENAGNVDAAFDVDLQNPDNALRFEVIPPAAQPGTAQNASAPAQQVISPDKPYSQRVLAGALVTLGFRARPARRALFGGEIVYPYTILVKPAGKGGADNQVFQGQLTGRAWFKVQVLSVILVILLGLVILSLFRAGQDLYQNHRATVTYQYGLSVAVSGTQTVMAYQALASATALSATQALTLPPPAQTPTLAPPTLAPKKTPTLPGLPGKIAFISARDGNPEIYVQNMATLGVTRLTDNPAVDTQPAWSPDGTRLAFASNRSGNYEIYLMNADGSDLINISNNPYNDQAPAWSPDGTRVAFASDRDGNWEVYAAAVDGSSFSNLTENPADDENPAWFRSGNKDRIAFATNRDSNFEIYIMNPDGSNPKNITGNAAADNYPAATSDGKRIVFASNRDGHYNIFVMGSNGESPINRTNSNYDDLSPSWSPDGKWIAFYSNRGNQEVYIIQGNGSNTTDISNNPAEDYYPDWH
jgi:Tol biopolymer transport system component